MRGVWIAEVAVFPACAGVILAFFVFNLANHGVPRVCGGDPRCLYALSMTSWCSPRVRG